MSTACQRCRSQKVRCDRNQPNCSRCVKFDSVCIYPEPPDRKLIAARRRRPQSHGNHIKQDQIKIDSSCPKLDEASQQTLITVFFTYNFKGTIIFNRPLFEEQYKQRKLANHTLYAVFAVAMNYLMAETPHNAQFRAELEHVDDFEETGKKYALSAGKQVLTLCDEPSIEVVQTCSNLGYYWFRHADSHRNAMFSSITYRAVRSMLMNTYEYPSWLDGEIIRRNFWAGWLHSCINSDEYVVGSAGNDLTHSTPLPVSEESYNIGREEAGRFLSDTPQAIPQVFSEWAELLRLIYFWAKVRDHLAQRNQHTADTILISTNKLQQEWNNVTSQLHPSSAYTKKNLFEQTVYKHQPLFATWHALQHHSRLALHMSVIPKFGGSIPPDYPSSALSTSLEASIQSAQRLSELAYDLVSFECDFVSIPPYVGYCMYVAGSIHATMINSASLGAIARKDLKSTLAFIQGMKPFWDILQRLWHRLLAVCEAKAAQGMYYVELLLPEGSFGSIGGTLEQDSTISAYSLTKVKPESKSPEDRKSPSGLPIQSENNQSWTATIAPSQDILLPTAEELESIEFVEDEWCQYDVSLGFDPSIFRMEDYMMDFV